MPLFCPGSVPGTLLDTADCFAEARSDDCVEDSRFVRLYSTQEARGVDVVSRQGVICRN